MQKTLLPCVVLALLFLVPAAARPSRQAEDETKLAQAMEGLRAEAKSLGKALETKDAAASWTAVSAMQARILAAKQETPAMAESKPAAERPAFVNAFRAKLSGALKATCDLEAAVLAGNFDDAQKLLREITGPMQKAGHREFRKED